MFSISLSESVNGAIANADEHATRAQVSRTEAIADAELVREFLAGNDGAFNEIVRRHQRRIFRLVLSCLHDRADAEEIVDDTFVRAHDGLSNFRGESSLATWLHHIAINLARNHYWYRFRRRHLRSPLDAPVYESGDVTVADFVASDTPDPSQQLERAEFSAIMTTCIERLPSRHRDILKLRSVLNRSYDQIAAVLGIKVGTVKSRIKRARQYLRTEVNTKWPEFIRRPVSSD
jgi:RNA polymerase sigma-70 factor, ECF subfamily